VRNSKGGTDAATRCMPYSENSCELRLLLLSAHLTQLTAEGAIWKNFMGQ
jgi:hypothetical protein